MPASSERLYFVAPYRKLGQRHPDLVPVSLPRDIGRFILDDDPDGFDVLLKHRGRWCPLDGDVWAARWAGGEAPTWAARMSVVDFGRKVLRGMHVRESEWSNPARGEVE